MFVYRKAILDDIPKMMKIFEFEVEKGLLLPRSRDSFASEIRSFFCAFYEDENQDGMDEDLVGFCALRIYSERLAEIRSLVVAEDYRSQGIGGVLVENTIQDGLLLGVREFLVLTYRVNFFQQLGFHQIPKENISDYKIWADCITCRHFPNCNEIALLKTF